MKVGMRVRMLDGAPGPKNVTGIVSEPPEVIKELSDGRQGIARVIRSRNRSNRTYWIKFDEPQFDADADGSCHEAEVDCRFLRVE